jgi:hypothetical protein
VDFTYLAAFVLAALVGIISQSVLLIMRLDERFGLGSVFGVALIVNVALAFNWRAVADNISSLTALVVVTDIILLPMCTFLGVLAGVLPFLIAVGICRKVFALGRKSAGS